MRDLTVSGAYIFLAGLHRAMYATSQSQIMVVEWCLPSTKPPPVAFALTHKIEDMKNEGYL